MNNRSLPSFCIKGVFFGVSIAAILFPFALQIRDHQAKYEPRTSLLRVVDLRGYLYALMGDSAFCSYYVNDDKDSIWMKFEILSGMKCFPGAVDDVKYVDYIQAAQRMAHLMPPRSTVFIDILAHRGSFQNRSDEGNYGFLLADVQRQEKFVIWKYFRYLNSDHLRYLKHFAEGVKTDRKPEDQYERVWNKDGDFALNRYKAYVEQFNRKSVDSRAYSIENSNEFIREIIEIFSKKEINTVFVLMPFNKAQIYSYSQKEEADKIYLSNKASVEGVKMFLKENNVPYIDLFDAVPDHCFADLVHVNACGDEIIAKALVNYVSPKH